MTEQDDKIQYLIEYELYTVQSHLVETALKSEFFSYEDVENLDDEETKECKDVYVWYAVSDYLAGHLREVGAVILDNDYGTWWGRCGFGFSLEYDSDLIAVAERVLR